MSSQYLAVDSFPKNKTESFAKCTIPGAGILTCGFVPLQIMLSRWMLRAESFICCGTSLDTKSERIERSLERTTDLRHLFLNETVLRRFPMRKSHSHANAASYRTAMNAYLKGLVEDAGLTPYMASMSAGDSKSGSRGSRLFYGLKDLVIKYQNDPVKDTDVIIMVDVDYYADMNRWLRYNRPILLYTLVPEACTSRTTMQEIEVEQDFAFRIVDNEVDFRVAGGASYRHKLWDYGVEKCSVINRDGTLSTFLVEQRKIAGDPLHRYVVITPEARVAMPSWLYLESLMAPLKRLEPLQDGINVMFDPITDKLSLSNNGSWQSVTLPGILYAAIQERVKAKTSELAVSDIERMLNAEHHKTSTTDAPLLYNMMCVYIHANIVTTNGVINYQPIGSLATEDGKVVGRQGTTPLVDNPALFPRKSVNSDEATIKGRVVDVANTTVPPVVFRQYANEFAQLVVPEELRNTGAPMSVKEVRNRQNSPAQQARYNQVANSMSVNCKNTLKGFMKAEAYSNISAPRNITTMDAQVTTLLSGYTLAMKEAVLKKHKWFGAGLKPTEQIARLQELTQRHRHWLCTDYTRLDGTVSEFLQKTVMLAVYLRWINSKHRADLRNQMLKVFVQSGKTSNGLRFEPGFGTRSGSPQTTDGNTLICTYVVYCAYRQLGYTPKEAFEALGLYYGDDGVTVADEGISEALEWCAMKLGLKLKCILVERGQPLPYLGRYFVDPYTTIDSFQDPMRTLAKIHLTANRELSVEQAMANKAIGYLATDRKTPLIGTWAAQVIKITGMRDLKNALHEEEYKANNSWPQEDDAAIEEAMSKVMELDVGAIREIDEALTRVEALDHFPAILSVPMEVKIDAVVGGEIRYAARPGPHVPQPPQNDRKSRPPKSQPAAIAGQPRTMDQANGKCDLRPACEPSSQTGRLRNESPPVIHAPPQPKNAESFRFSGSGKNGKTGIAGRHWKGNDNRKPKRNTTRPIKPGERSGFGAQQPSVEAPRSPASTAEHQRATKRKRT